MKLGTSRTNIYIVENAEDTTAIAILKTSKTSILFRQLRLQTPIYYYDVTISKIQIIGGYNL